MDLIDGRLFGDEELFGWSHLEVISQWLDVQVEIGDKWCPLMIHVGTGAV